MLITELDEEVEDLRLNDDVERRGRLVQNDEPRAAGESTRDHDPLSLTAGELVRVNQHQAPNEFTLTVVCERGTIRWESHGNRLSSMIAPSGVWHEDTIAPLERDTLFVRQAHRFLDAVETGSPPPCSIADGLQTLRVNLAALASADGGGWQTVSDGS